MTSSISKTGLSGGLAGFFEEEAAAPLTPDVTDDAPQNQDAHPKGFGSIVPVLVPVPTSQAYSYLVGEGHEVVAGSIVQVPLGSRSVIGICLLYTSPSPRDQRGSRMPSSA